MRWFLIDRLVEVDPGKTAVAVKCFTRSEAFFEQHFPGMPIVPGVLQVEMIAQTAGKCIRALHPEYLTVLGQVKGAKFYRNIEPGDQCFIKIEVEKIRPQYALAKGHIEVNGQKVSSAEIMYGVVPSNSLKEGHVDEVMADYLKRKEARREQNPVG